MADIPPWAEVECLRHALQEAGKEMDRRYEMGVTAERERCAQLAESLGATYHAAPFGPNMPSIIMPFASLLRQDGKGSVL